MCGIVGLFYKNGELEQDFGRCFAQMLSVMADRGPDSAGFAVYGSRVPDVLKMTVRIRSADYDVSGLKDSLARHLNGDVRVARNDSHAVIEIPAGQTRARTEPDPGGRLFYIPRGNGNRVRRIERPDFLQTRRAGGDRCVCRVRIGISRTR